MVVGAVIVRLGEVDVGGARRLSTGIKLENDNYLSKDKVEHIDLRLSFIHNISIIY